jgi:hypothetical protein
MSQGRHIRQAFCTHRHFRLHAAENGMVWVSVKVGSERILVLLCRQEHVKEL